MQAKNYIRLARKLMQMNVPHNEAWAILRQAGLSIAGTKKVLACYPQD